MRTDDNFGHIKNEILCFELKSIIWMMLGVLNGKMQKRQRETQLEFIFANLACWNNAYLNQHECMTCMGKI